MLPMLLIFSDLNTYKKYDLNRNYDLIFQGLRFFNLSFFNLLCLLLLFFPCCFKADTYEIS